MYRVVLQRRAQKQINRLSTEAGRRIYAAITALGSNPRPPGCLKLTDSGQWRIHVGHDYRVIYEINDTEVLVTIVWAVLPLNIVDNSGTRVVRAFGSFSGASATRRVRKVDVMFMKDRFVYYFTNNQIGLS